MFLIDVAETGRIALLYLGQSSHQLLRVIIIRIYATFSGISRCCTEM